MTAYCLLTFLVSSSAGIFWRVSPHGPGGVLHTFLMAFGVSSRLAFSEASTFLGGISPCGFFLDFYRAWHILEHFTEPSWSSVSPLALSECCVPRSSSLPQPVSCDCFTCVTLTLFFFLLESADEQVEFSWSFDVPF